MPMVRPIARLSIVPLRTSLLGRTSCRRSVGGVARLRARGRAPDLATTGPVHQLGRANGVDIARLGLLGAFSMPFVMWIAAFAYDYSFRVRICQDALGRTDDGLSGQEGGAGEAGGFLGRDRELADVSSLLDRDPSQILVIAGGNEVGKSRFVREVLRGARDRGVTLVKSAQLVDSVNAFCHVFVDAFDLRWLRLRNALVDMLPFAGSEILVMKERFSDRDLAQALVVITDALRRNAKVSGPGKPRPVIVIDGLGEGPRRWLDSAEGKSLAQRLFQWSIYITKECCLAHIVLTGSEELVLSLTDQNRSARGHVKVVGLGDVGLEDAAKIIRSNLADASDDEVKRITNIFGGSIHDTKCASRDIQRRIAQSGKEASEVGSKKRKKVVDEVIKARFQQQLERITGAFADAREDGDPVTKDAEKISDSEDMDPYLDPLKEIYSEFQASSQAKAADESDRASWTQLQLWRTLQRLVDSPSMAVSFSELRDTVFNGDKTPILELMAEDVLSFEVNRSSDGGWFWKVTPTSPALGLALTQIVQSGSLKERFRRIEEASERIEEKNRMGLERARLYSEKKLLDRRKESLLRTVELGKIIGQEEVAQQQLALAFKEIIREEEMFDADDRLLRDRLSALAMNSDDKLSLSENDSAKVGTKRAVAEDGAIEESHLSLQSLLKSAVLDIMSAGGGSNGKKYLQLKHAFDVLDKTKDGQISAKDVVKAVKESTGHSVSIAAAEELVNDWDLNGDKSLDYYEFLQLVLSDGKRRSIS